MTEAPPNGAPTSEEEQMRLFAAHQVEAIAATLVQHMPSLASDPEKLGRFCFGLLQEQPGMLDVFVDASDPASRAQHPWWGYVLTDRKGGEIKVKCPKDINEAVQVPQHLFNFTSIVGLLLNPTCRGILGASGIQVRFFQCEADTSRLIQA